MTMHEDVGAQMHAVEVQQCIAVCQDAHRRSVEVVAHYVRLRGGAGPAPYLKLLHDAAQITLATADALAQHAPDAARTCTSCAEITYQAAQATEGLAPDSQMQTFIRQCRACAAACHQMARQIDALDRR